MSRSLFFSNVCFALVLSLSAIDSAYGASEQEQEQESSSQEQTPQTEQNGEAEKNSQASKAADQLTIINRQTRRSNLAIAPPLAQSALASSDLKHYLPPENQKPVLVSSDEYQTLVTTNATANNKGVMILLADWQQSATSPKAINYLRQSMPEQGWTTISIQPPEKPDTYPSRAIDKTQQQQENQQALSEYRQQLAKLLTEVMQRAKTYPGIIVMVAEGHHSALLLSLYQQELAEKPMTLVSLSGFLSDSEGNNLSAKALSQLDLPVLDLYLKTDHGLIKQAVKLRQKLVNQELKSYFRQRELFNSRTGYYPKQTLVKEINGWLRSQGW